MEYLTDECLDTVIGGLAVQITNTISGSTATTGNANGLINGVSHALSIVGYNPTPLLFQVVAS